MKCHGWLSFEWAGGWVGKGEASLEFDKKIIMLRICFTNDTRGPRPVCAGGGQLQDARFGAPKVEVLSLFVCVARALNRCAAFSFHVDTCIFPRDKTGLTMGKPAVNPTFIPSLIHVYLRNSARVRQEDYVFGS